MAYFIRINETCFKVPHRLVVGRGEPFTILNDDRSVARSHLLILKKRNKYYVKDLETESGSFIDGKKIKPKRLVEVKPDVPVKIGNSEVVILSAQPAGSFVEIKGNSLKVQTSELHYPFIITSILFGFALMNVFSEWKNGKSFPFLILFFFGQLVFVGIMGFLTSKFIKFMKSMSPNILVNDVFFSEEGFTVHYADGGNMTFKTNKIESWNLGSNLIEVNMYGEKHILASNKEQLQIFEIFFSKHLKNKKITVKRSLAGVYGLLACVCFIVLAMESTSFFQLGITACGVLVMGCVAMLIKPELRNYWIIPVNRNFSASKQVKSIVFAGVFAVYSAHLIIDYKGLVENLAACTSKDPVACKELNMYGVIANRLEISNETAKFACEKGNAVACRLKPKRSVASEE